MIKNMVLRRSFIKSAAYTSVGFAVLPNFISCSPSGKLNIAVIGVGGRGEKNWEPCMNENIVALCDVDDGMAANGFELLPEARRFKDYRVMFDKMANEIDAVIISTPNHTHYLPAMIAMQLGMHVFVEKPLAHDVLQVRNMKKAANYYKVVSQMGNQGHTTDGIRRVKEYYEADLLGEVDEVYAWFSGPNFGPGRYFKKPDSFPPSVADIPKELVWDLWVGPAKNRPYNDYYHPRLWRGWYDFGNGLIGDWAAHTLDAPFWALNPGMPVVAEAEIRSISADGFIPDESVVRMEFPREGKKPLIFKWYEGGLKPEKKENWFIDELPDTGMIMSGSKRPLITGGRPDNVNMLIPDSEKEELIANLPEPTIPRIGTGPQTEWLKAIKGTGPMPGSSFDYSADLTEMIFIGQLAQRFNTRLEYDPGNMKITNNPEVDQYLGETARDGWGYKFDL